jgi:hypothetical protein
MTFLKTTKKTVDIPTHASGRGVVFFYVNTTGTHNFIMDNNNVN